MPAPQPPRITPAARIVAGNLRVDSATAEVLRAFDVAGVESLLLKGASIVHWLYEADNPRAYVDCDLLVRPAHGPAAGQVLAGIGFEPALEDEQMPSWWREHAVAWVRQEDGVIVDLHRTLAGVGVDAEKLWLTLSGDVERIVVAEFDAATLAIPGRAFHLALHAAQHGVGWEGPLHADLERAVSSTEGTVWKAAAEIAASLRGTAAFATGLRMVPAGEALASELDLPAGQPVDVALRASSAPPVALGFEQLASARGLGARLRIVRHKAFPPTTFMRAWSPRANQGRLGLMLAYAWRPLWILRNAPTGFKAWRAARRSAGD